MQYVRDWWETVKAVLTSPDDFYSQMPTTGGYEEPLKFALQNLSVAILLVFGLLLFGGSVSGLPMSSSGALGFSMFMVLIGFLIGGVVALFAGALVYYISMKMVGGQGTYEGTFRTMAYASAIAPLLVIPLISLLGYLYQLYLFVVGWAHAHNTTKLRAFGGYLVPPVTIFLIGAILVLIPF